MSLLQHPIRPVPVYILFVHTQLSSGEVSLMMEEKEKVCALNIMGPISLETDFSLVSQQGIASASATAPFPSTNEKSVSQTTSAVPVIDAFGN